LAIRLVALVEQRDLLVAEPQVPTNVGQPRTQFQSPLWFHRFLQDGAHLRLGAAPVLGRAQTQGAMNLVGQIANRQNGHDDTSKN
jgi:hypothetical protein